MKTALFLVKNGIGFGHIRRALLIAEEVQARGRLRPVMVSQASSLALYRHSRVRVVNFPLLHRVPSAVTEDWYTEVLNRLVQRLDPAVVIEDTYPDTRYQRLPALANRPRLLVMRRLDSASFDQIRTRGGFDHYDQVLIAQDSAAFDDEGHSGESLAAVQRSGRFTFVGNIAYQPHSDEVRRARTAYSPHGEPLVVVNGGAGGDQMPDGYGDRLFSACHQVASQLAAEGHPARFVFVIGPYYAGRPLPEAPNLDVRTFEPNLAALLAAADVAVIKPGNNALSEALSGTARLVLVPDVSFMEGVSDHADRIVSRYGGTVSKPDRASLEPIIREALTLPPRTAHPSAPGTALRRAVEAIHAHSSPGYRACVRPKGMLLLLALPSGSDPPAQVRTTLPPSLRGITILDEPNPTGVATLATILADPGAAPAAALIGDPGPTTPQELTERGIRIVLHTGPAAAVSRWLRLHPSRPAVLAAQAHLHRGSADAFTRHVSRLFRHDSSAVVLLDLQDVDAAQLPEYLCYLATWLDGQPVRLVSADTVSRELAQRLLLETAT